MSYIYMEHVLRPVKYNIYITIHLNIHVFIHRSNTAREHDLLCVHNKSVESLHGDLSDTIYCNIHTLITQTSGRFSHIRQR